MIVPIEDVDQTVYNFFFLSLFTFTLFDRYKWLIAIQKWLVD